MDWLTPFIGNGEPDLVNIALLVAGLLVVLLIVIWLFRKIFGGASSRLSKSRQPRLSVTDAAIVDDKRRLVLVRRDHVEHLVMIGGPSDIVIEQNIVRASSVDIPKVNQSGMLAASSTNDTSQSSSAPAAITATAAMGAGLVSATGKAGSSLSETVKEATAATAETAKSATGSATRLGSDVVETASDGLQTGTENFLDGTAKVQEAVSDLGGDLTETIGDALGIDPASSPEIDVADADGPSNKTEDEMQRLLDELSGEKI